MHSIELVELYLDLSLVKLGLTLRRIALGFTEIFGFFKVFLGFFSSILGFSPVRGGLFEKVNSAFDRARRVLSWSIFGQTWSNSQANRPWKYSNPPVRYPTSNGYFSS